MAGEGQGVPPTERILALGVYAAERARQHQAITLHDITAEVPGYDDGSAPRDPAGYLVKDTPQWEALRRRVRRDIEDLEAAWGIHLDFDAERNEYRLQPPFFTEEERNALIAAAATVHVEGITEDLPGEVGTGVDDSTALVVLQVHPLVAELRAFIAARRPVQFRHDGRERHVEPWATGEWRSRWYLACRDRDAAAPRVYRLDRIEGGDGPALTPCGPPGAYEIPADFDPASRFDLDPNAWGPDPCLRARVRVTAHHVPTFQHELGGEEVERGPGWSTIELDVRHYEAFRNRVLAFRGNAVVLDPPELVTMMHDHLAALAGGA